MNLFIAVGLPFLTIIVFLVGMGYRFLSWVKAPQPGRMTLFPAPPADKSLFWPIVKESLFFPSLFKGDKSLWIVSWVFHAMLLLIIIGHLRVFTAVFDNMLTAFGVNVEVMSSTAGGAAGIVILICGLMLLIRRMTLRRVKEVTNPSDFMALLLLLAIIITGDMMRFAMHFDLEVTRTYFAQLFTFSFVGMSLPESGLFWTHFILVQLLIMYIPYSKILHFGGIFFTQTLIQKS